MRDLEVSPAAEKDIRVTGRWLQVQYRVAVAVRWTNAMRAAFQKLVQNPEMHPVAEELDFGELVFHEMIVRRFRGVVYRIIYSFDDTTVTIHRVRNAVQDSLTEDDF